MINSPRKIAIILYPSIRSMTYLQAILDLKFKIDEIVLLKSNFNVDKIFLNEYSKYNYENFLKIEDFSLIYDINSFCKSFDVKIYESDSSDINDASVINFVKKLKSDFVLFTGGGILKKDILSLGKKFIHIHPGALPNYRGSTCFYYSILDNCSVGSTAFIMDESLDTGNIIISNNFSINYYINKDQPFFIDHVLDNYIRVKTLELVLQMFKSNEKTSLKKNNNLFQPFYIAHPLIRHLAIEKINLNYKLEKKSGVFLK